MSNEKGGMKSAYELAMERLEQQSGKQAPVTGEQKAAMAEVDEKTRAGMAEVEIMTQQRKARAQADGDPGKLAELEEERVREIQKLRDRAESEKTRIRGE